MPEGCVRRVLMTTDTVGGVWTFSMELAAALEPYDVEIVLAAMGGRPSRDQRREGNRHANVRLLTSTYRLEWMEEPWRDVEESGRWLLELESAVRPDVVHLNSYGHGALDWNSPVVLTAHSCVLSWWLQVKGNEAPSAWDRYRQLVRHSVAGADVITAPSKAMLRAIRESSGSRLSCPRVVYNGRNSSRYRVADKDPLILTAGRLWDEAKNVAALSHIAAKLPWPVCVAGEDREPGGGSVSFPGCQMLGRLTQAELARWYARAPIYALPALYEPFGLTILEAALSGCALVLGDIASLRELWEDCAIYVPPHDKEELEGLLLELIENQAMRETMARRSYARAQMFTADRMAREYLGIYASLARGGRVLCAS
jgi:glycosyltransferase involved in cell wall biosynthesis